MKRSEEIWLLLLRYHQRIIEPPGGRTTWNPKPHINTLGGPNTISLLLIYTRLKHVSFLHFIK